MEGILRGVPTPMTEPSSPHEIYSRRLGERREATRLHARTEAAISNTRLVVAVAFVLLLWLALGPQVLSLAWLILPLAAFVALVVMHERVIQARRKSERAAAFYERGLARLEHRWVGQGETGERFLAGDHLFSGDLDLFGRGSLFELISTARTRSGEETLAAWMRAPSPPAEVRARHEAVSELMGRIDLREDLFLLGADIRAGIEPDLLAAWGAEPGVFPAGGGSLGSIRFAAPVLAMLTMAALAGWGFAGIGPVPFAAAALLAAVTAWPLRSRVSHVIGAVERAARDLELLSAVLERLERERFTSPRLAALRATLDTEGVPPSRRIHRLRRLVELLDARRNQLFSPFAYLLLWSTQLAFAIETWRSVSGQAVSRWLAAVGELEALCSLAGYAWENPSDPFPEIVEEGPCFTGEGLGHPLIPSERCVRNSISLNADLRVLVVSGSNMSGKSTLLRTVGVNAVLAMAGAPVRAAGLRLSPLAVGASLTIHDSLQTGTSRFYAEITRLRQIMDLTDGSLPALFLIDEVLHGTNSHDRRIGAEAVVRGLVERGAVGLVTTHDLALSHIVETLAPRAANVHFEDHLQDGMMTFDYIMRPGVVKKSNALELMRAVGLDV